MQDDVFENEDIYLTLEEDASHDNISVQILFCLFVYFFNPLRRL